MLHLFYQGEMSDAFCRYFHLMLIATWVAVTADAFRWMFQNVLIAADDVHFAVISNVSCFWLAAFAPIFLFVYELKWQGALFCWLCFTLDSLMRIVSDFFRIRSATWRRKAAEATQFSQIQFSKSIPPAFDL
jgi:Na+-driven multidrug efflux pump